MVKVESSKEESIDLGSDHIEQQITDLAQKAEDKLQKEQEKNKDRSSSNEATLFIHSFNPCKKLFIKEKISVS